MSVLWEWHESPPAGVTGSPAISKLSFQRRTERRHESQCAGLEDLECSSSLHPGQGGQRSFQEVEFHKEETG